MDDEPKKFPDVAMPVDVWVAQELLKAPKRDHAWRERVANVLEFRPPGEPAWIIEERTRLGRLEIAAEEAEKFTAIFGEAVPVKALRKHLGILILATQESLARRLNSDG